MPPRAIKVPAGALHDLTGTDRRPLALVLAQLDFAGRVKGKAFEEFPRHGDGPCHLNEHR
jgi:hypothetical protein